MQYRIRYKQGHAALGGLVRFSVQLDSSVDGVTWDPIDGGTTDLSVSASELLVIINNGSLSGEQKLGEVHGLLMQQVEAMGVIQSLEALRGVEALLPSGWPVVVGL